MSADLSKLAFLSSVNYMKRSVAFSGSAVVTLPAYGSTVTYTVTHNLGLVHFDVFIDIDNDGTIWSSEKVDQNTDSSLFADPATPIVDYWSTTTALTININNTTTPTATGTRTIYWVVYSDYTNV